MASILSRLERIEAQVLPGSCVGILELQPNGGWLLIEDGKHIGQYATEADGAAAFRGEHLIIVDI